MTLVDGSLGGEGEEGGGEVGEEGEERRKRERRKRRGGRKRKVRREQEATWLPLSSLPLPPTLSSPYPPSPFLPPSPILLLPSSSLTLNILIFSMSIGSEREVAWHFRMEDRLDHSRRNLDMFSIWDDEFDMSFPWASIATRSFRTIPLCVWGCVVWDVGCVCVVCVWGVGCGGVWCVVWGVGVCRCVCAQTINEPHLP